ncbi:MAG: hypothetical protein HQ490_00935 [Lutibacter sp.]|nr:hypothetical protein [Lutibacter sp.]
MNSILRPLKHYLKAQFLSKNESIIYKIKYVSTIYNLDQKMYFIKSGEWSYENMQEWYGIENDDYDKLPDYLYPWHIPAIEFLSDLNKDISILDLNTGIPTFPYYLSTLGFNNLNGCDNSKFQSNILKAAKLFAKKVNLNINLIELDPGYYGDYIKIGKKFDVITNFGVVTYFFLPLVYPILKDNGYFISETLHFEIPSQFQSKFKIVKRFDDFGKRLDKLGGGNVTIFQKIG